MTETLSPNLEFIQEFEHPWFVVGGWALDLYMGGQSREHHDLDVGIFRSSQLALQSLLLKQNWKLEWIKEGKGYAWEEGQYLDLPVHEIWGFKADPNIEILLNEFDGENWLYRRDNRIKLAYKDAILKEGIIPYLAPEAVLLFKSKHIRPVDDDDFINVLPCLSIERKHWLKQALELQDASHRWISMLG